MIIRFLIAIMIASSIVIVADSSNTPVKALNCSDVKGASHANGYRSQIDCEGMPGKNLAPKESPKPIESRCELGQYEGVCITDITCMPYFPNYSVTNTESIMMKIITTEDGNDHYIPNGCGNGPANTVSTEELAVKAFFELTPIAVAPSIEPNEVTLCGWDTNFFTTTGQQDSAQVLNGRAVTLRAIPVSYTWDFGEGEKWFNEFPGKSDKYSSISEYRDTGRNPRSYGFVTYRYERMGHVATTVTIHFRGEFSVDGGPFRGIDGTVSAQSPATPLDVWSARSELIDPNDPPKTKNPANTTG